MLFSDITGRLGFSSRCERVWRLAECTYSGYFFATVIIFRISTLNRVRTLIGSDVFGESHQPVSVIFVIIVWEWEQMREKYSVNLIHKFPDLKLAVQVRLLRERDGHNKLNLTKRDTPLNNQHFHM